MTEQTIPETPEIPENFSGDNVRASWPFSLHQIRQNIAHCSPEGKEALVAAFLWCIDKAHPVRKREFAARVNYSENLIYKIYTGKYQHPESKKALDVPPDLVKNIKHFLALEKERFLGGKVEFVMTPTARKIFTACDLARESKTPVFLWGPSHIGKTWALNQYTQDHNHGRTVYNRMKAASGLGGMVRSLAECAGVSPKGNTAKLIKEYKNALTGDMLIILDELHLLMYTYRRESFFACMEVLREVYDECGCGMLFSGTQLLLDKINEGKGGEMDQLLRRGVHRVQLGMPTKADVSCILAHWKLDVPKKSEEVTIQKITERPYEVLRMLAKNNGLKSITERLRYGKKLSQRAGEKLSWKHFLEAHLAIHDELTPEEDWD